MEMVDTSAARQSTLHMILPHPTEPRSLMLLGTGGWALPSIRLAERIPVNRVSHISRAMRRELGIDVTVLRCAEVRVDHNNSDRTDVIYVLEHHSASWTPPNRGSWVDSESLAGLTLARPEHRAVLEAYLDEAVGEAVPELRPQWARRGWFDEAVSWMQKQLARLDYVLISPIEQERTWGISCILRGRTTSGDIYFKAATRWPLAAHEPALTQALAGMYPDCVAAPLAVDFERHWMLLPDLGLVIDGESDVSIYEESLRKCGEVQRDSAARVDELFAAGCTDRRLPVLEAQIDPLLGDPDALSRLSAPEIDQIRGLGPELKRKCSELADYKVPPTLVHGDFHPANMARHHGGDVFLFDWTDGCVSHPFFDLVTMLDNDNEFPVVHAARRRLLDVYVSVWLDYEPMERLRGVRHLAKPLGALHQAITYRDVVSKVEAVTRGQMESGLDFWLRKILRWMG